MPVFGEKTEMKVAAYGTYRVYRVAGKKSSAANQNQSYNSEKFPADEKIERVARFNEIKIWVKEVWSSRRKASFCDSRSFRARM